MSQRATAEGAPQPSPECLAVAKFLRYNSALKNRVGVVNGKRVEFFKGKRAIRLLESEEYKKKSKKLVLPNITSRDEAVAVFRKLQASLLALRVEKVSAHHDHDHEHTDPPKKKKDKEGKKKKKKKSTDKPKPAQHLQIQRDQASYNDIDYFAWFYETTGLQTILGGIGIVIVVFGAILFPLWPPVLRTAVWYLSIALLGLIGLIAVIAVVRLILFIFTMFAVPPGIWLFPNLFEDVGFFESFVPLWAWQKQPKGKKKKASKGEKNASKPDTSILPVVADQSEKRLQATVEDASDTE